MNINSLILETMYLVPKRKKKKVKDFNPKTNRMKKFKRTMYYKTNIEPKDRTLKNKPDSVGHQEWLKIKREKNHAYGKSEYDGKWYG